MNKMKRILTIVLTLALIVTMMPMNLTNVNARTTTRLSSKKIVLQVGKTKKLKVKNKPAGVKVVWKSSKKKVATVSKKGKVKAKKAGKTTITAKVGKKKYKCRVIVRNKTNNVSQNVTKPANDNQNVTNKVTVTKPEGTTVRPITTTKPEGTTVRPTTTTKPEGTTVRPTTTTKPEGTTVRPTTTTKPEGTTVRPTTTTKPEETTVRPTEPNVDNDIQAPVGLIHAPGEGLPYHFAWAAVDGADGYNVYIDGVYVTKVTENVADLDASMFTKGAVEYTVGIATVKGDKISAITSVKYTYDGNGAQATTNVSVTTTVASVTTPSVPGQDVDESIKAPEGLVWSGNADLPYYFAWAKADGIDSYNVYVDGTLVANVVDGSVNLNESVFTKGSGEYSIGIAAVKGNKTSAITSIKYIYAGSGQPATTKAPEPSTAKPTDVTVAPTAPGQDVDESIQAPAGLVWAGNTDLPYYFAWGPVSDVDSYNVYVDGVYATNVGASSVNLDKAVFTKGSGEYTIGVASVKNNKISSITSIKYTYAESGQPATTKAPEPSTAKPTDVTVAPTA
ncbi:Ig-like domain-containing protein, partial [Eubacterium ventriosum]|uniref:Ig-like domain-containing protein n=1 Tax=Eubacterium ventriosum TaxID=39496 RepID=UPI001C00F03F